MCSPRIQLALAVVCSCFAGSASGQAVQRPVQSNGDCSGAILIQDSVYVQHAAVRGFGNVLEIKENPKDMAMWLEREHHTTWYRFRTPWATRLTFDIVPHDPLDDYDFLLFRGAVNDFCEKVANRELQPVRSNISRNDPRVGSRCGLAEGVGHHYMRSGLGEPYSAALDVEQGELFYLVVDNSQRPRAGYTIHLHYGPVPVMAEDKPQDRAQRRQVVEVSLRDAKTGIPVNGMASMVRVGAERAEEASGSATLNFMSEPYRNLKLGCAASGYMFRSMVVKGTGEDTLRVAVDLTPIVEGGNAVLDDIRFVGNDAKVLRSSESSLMLLLRFMQLNPGVGIMIEGHVNGPTYKNTKEFVELSKARALVVYNFLLVNDVDPRRIGYEGLGNSRMLFPDPKGQAQSEANRRVEVRVVSVLRSAMDLSPAAAAAHPNGQ